MSPDKGNKRKKISKWDYTIHFWKFSYCGRSSVVCIIEPLFYATVSPFPCIFHITIGDTDQNINSTMLQSHVFKFLLVPNFLQNKSPTLSVIIKERPFNI